MLIDSHCHLDFPEFEAELDAIITRARAAGVGGMVTVCTRIRRAERLRDIAERFPNVCYSIGTHPHYAHEELDISLAEMLKMADHPKMVAFGEAGLDYYYKKSPAADQARGFRLHIAAARDSDLPLIIHTRDAEDDTAAILADEMAKGPFRALLHCYTGSAELLQAALPLGVYVSFSGVLTFKKSEALRDVAAGVPLDRLLVETDAPFLAPQPYRGKRNEPVYVRETARVLAEVKGVSEAEIARITTENFFRLFSKAAGVIRVEASPAE